MTNSDTNIFYNDKELKELGRLLEDAQYKISNDKYEKIVKAHNTLEFDSTPVVFGDDEEKERNEDLLSIFEWNDFSSDLESKLVNLSTFEIKKLNVEDIKQQYLATRMTTHSKQKDIKSLEIEKVYTPFPHMRKRRKKWAGKPTYRTYELNVKVSYGYAKRSMLRHFPAMTTYDWKKTKERTRRSLSHTYLWKFAEMTTFETLNTRFDDDLFSAYKELGYKIMQDEMYTDDMKEAWQTYMSEGMFEQFLQDNYASTISAFAELAGAVKDFIANEWDKYSKEARSAREERYGMSLDKKQVDSLQDADLSYL